MGTDETTIETEDSSPFRSEAEYDATAADLIQEMIDIWVITPAKILWSDYRGRFGILVLTLYILLGTVGTVVIREPAIAQGPLLLQPGENMAFPLGTDGQGQGMLALMVHGTPMIFKMILSGALFGGIMGVAVGMIAGYKGGLLDKVLMTLGDTLASIPGLPLLLILVALFEPSNPWLVGIILNINGWVGASRGIRAQTFAIRKKEYVEAAEAMGESTSNILFKEVLPEMMPMIAFGFIGGATGIISASVALYFLGILPVNTRHWGYVLRDAYTNSGALYSTEALHWLLVPSVTITGLTIAFVLVAQATDQIFNPRVRARHESRKRSADDEVSDESDDMSEDAITQVGIQ